MNKIRGFKLQLIECLASWQRRFLALNLSVKSAYSPSRDMFWLSFNSVRIFSSSSFKLSPPPFIRSLSLSFYFFCSLSLSMCVVIIIVVIFSTWLFLLFGIPQYVSHLTQLLCNTDTSQVGMCFCKTCDIFTVVVSLARWLFEMKIGKKIYIYIHTPKQKWKPKKRFFKIVHIHSKQQLVENY